MELTGNAKAFTIEEAGDLTGIDYHRIQKAAMILRSLNHRLRQQMIKTIHDNKRITVTQLYVKLRIEQSVASQHLAILRRAGIVTTERDGKRFFILSTPREYNL